MFKFWERRRKFARGGIILPRKPEPEDMYVKLSDGVAYINGELVDENHPQYGIIQKMNKMGKPDKIRRRDASQ